VPAAYHDRYRGKAQDDDTAKLYGMVANIDDNLGRLFGKLTELGLDSNTIVIFMTDNGPQVPRYNGILNNTKAAFMTRNPRAVPPPLAGQFQAGAKMNEVAAHIDLAPTLLEACRVERPPAARFDGASLLPLLRGGGCKLARSDACFSNGIAATSPSAIGRARRVRPATSSCNRWGVTCKRRSTPLGPCLT